MPQYGATRSFCSIKGCSSLAAAAAKEATLIGSKDDPLVVFDANELPPPERKSWTRLAGLYAKADPGGAGGLETFGHDHSDFIDSYVGWDTSFFPMRLDGRLLLANIGTIGFGSKFGADKGSSVYGWRASTSGSWDGS